MSRRIPKQYTLLIACSGQSPVTISFHPLVLITCLAASIALPALWIFNVIHSYAEKNFQLTEKNTSLTQQATDILEQVEVLEAEIQTLQERAGVSDPGQPAREGSSSHFEGGVGIPVDAETVLQLARAKIPGLLTDLHREVRPALEETLEQEEARPRGVPLKGLVEQSSPFGLRRNPFGRGYEFHAGLDFKGAYGSPIHVTAPGIVVKAEWDGGYGYHVVVDHGYGYRTLYAHMSKMAVTQGMKLDRDRIIGYLGNTGRSSGPHLHYGVYRSENAVNPEYYLN